MTLLDGFRQDLRYATRSLRRTPAFTAAAILTLALGIGANTAIFSLIQAVLLRPLPIDTPGEVYFVVHGARSDLSRSSNYRWLERVQQRADVFTGVTAYSHRTFKVTSGAGVEQVAGQFVRGNYHGVLGVPLTLGRGFTAENDRIPGGSPLAVISDDYWSRRFGRSPDALGATLMVGGHPVTIVGVTAPGFRGLSPGDSIDVTLPLSMRLLDESDFLDWTDTWTSMPIVVRLRPGVSPGTASQAVAATYRDYMTEPFNADFRQTPGGEPTIATLVPGARGDGELREEYRTALQALMAMVGVVLLIACVNVANLLVVRATARSKEVAMRLSVGADYARLFRQFVTEGLVLSLAGGALGFVLAGWGTRFVSSLLGTGLQPIVIDTQPDATVLLFTGVVAMLTGLAFSIGPTVSAAKVNVTPALKNLPDSAGRPRWRRSLVAVQVALCVILAFGAGLLMRTLENLKAVDGGFATDGLVVFALDARDTPFPRDRMAPLCTEIVARLEGRPDVTAGTCSTMSPIDTSSERRVITVDGAPVTGAEPPTVYANSVDAAYFETYGISLLSGRGFERQDNEGAPQVAVISETTARRYFGDLSPIGRTFRWGRRDPTGPITVVGVSHDARLTLRDAPPAMIYTPLSQRPEPSPDLLAAIRTSGPQSAIAAAIRDAIRGSSRDVALIYLRSMDQQIDAALVGERLLATLSAAFGGLALLLACVGLYGVISYEVSRRRRDIGVRLALGAARSTVLVSVLRQTALITGIGLAAGVAGAIVTSQIVSRFLFGVEPRDPTTLAVAAGVLAATSMLAGYFPARRASRVDPAMILRSE